MNLSYADQPTSMQEIGLTSTKSDLTGREGRTVRSRDAGRPDGRRRWRGSAVRAARGLVAVAGIALLAACASTGSDSGSTYKSAEKPKTPTTATGDPSSTDPSKGGPGRPIKVALLLPLSGNYEVVGKAMRKAAEMAVFEAGSKNFQLIPIDTLGTPDGAAAAADKAISEGAQLILGPLFSASVKAVRERAAAANLNIVAFSNDTEVAGGNVFLISFLPKPQVFRIVDYAAKQGLRRLAVLTPDNAYGRLVLRYAREAAERHNMTIARTGTYPSDSTDVSKEVQAFAGVSAVVRKGRVVRSQPIDFDAVLIPEGGQKLRLVGSLLSYYEVDPDKIRFLGTGRWDGSTVRSEPSLKGGWFATTPPDLRERFIVKYEQANGSRPPRLASLSYDAVALAATLARTAKADDTASPFTVEAITNPSGFIGIDGIFRFGADGLAERGLAVLEVTPDEFRVISPAPSTFATGTN